MKKELKPKEGERLFDWCSRLADYLAEKQRGRKEIWDIIRTVSIHSYAEGSNATDKVWKDQLKMTQP